MYDPNEDEDDYSGGCFEPNEGEPDPDEEFNSETDD